MSSIRAIFEGLFRTLSAPGLLLGLCLLNLSIALPLAGVIGLSIDRSIGASRVDEDLRRGFDMGWYGEYAAETRGVEASFRPSVIGATAFYDNLESWISGNLFRQYPALAGAGLLYALVWTFVLGGVVDRFCNAAPPRESGRFAGACVRYFFRFLRLALISAIAYAAIFRLHGAVFRWLEGVTRDVARETTVMGFSMAGYGLTAFLLTLVHMCFGYAKIATVAEDRKSMVLAALRGIGFVFSNPLRTFVVYYGVLLVSALALLVYGFVAPGAGQSSWIAVFFALAVGQLFLLVKMVLRLTLLGGMTALYTDS